MLYVIHKYVVKYTGILSCLMLSYIYYIIYYIYYMTLHYITLHCIALHCINYITLYERIQYKDLTSHNYKCQSSNLCTAIVIFIPCLRLELAFARQVVRKERWVESKRKRRQNLSWTLGWSLNSYILNIVDVLWENMALCLTELKCVPGPGLGEAQGGPRARQREHLQARLCSIPMR